VRGLLRHRAGFSYAIPVGWVASLLLIDLDIELIMYIIQMFSDGSESVLPPPPQPLRGYPGGYPAPTLPAGSPAYLIPQLSTSGRLDLGNMKAVNSGSVIFNDAVARAWTSSPNRMSFLIRVEQRAVRSFFSVHLYYGFRRLGCSLDRE